MHALAVVVLALPALALALNLAVLSPAGPPTTPPTPAFVVAALPSPPPPPHAGSGGPVAPWAKLGDVPRLAEPYAVAMGGSDGGTLLVLGRGTAADGSDANVIVASPDGRTWEDEPVAEIPLQAAGPFFMAISPASRRGFLTPGFLDADVGLNVWISSDAGGQWTLAHALPGLVCNATKYTVAALGAVVFGANNASRGAMLAAASADGGPLSDVLLTTTDGGLTWLLHDLALPALGPQYATAVGSSLAVTDDTIVLTSSYRSLLSDLDNRCFVADVFAVLDAGLPWLSTSWQTPFPCSQLAFSAARSLLPIPPLDDAADAAASPSTHGGFRLFTARTGALISDTTWLDWDLVATPSSAVSALAAFITTDSTITAAGAGTCSLYSTSLLGDLEFVPVYTHPGATACIFGGHVNAPFDPPTAPTSPAARAALAAAPHPPPPPPPFVADWIAVGTGAAVADNRVRVFRFSVGRKPDGAPAVVSAAFAGLVDVPCPTCPAVPVAAVSDYGVAAVGSGSSLYVSRRGGTVLGPALASQPVCAEFGDIAVANRSSNVAASLFATCAIAFGTHNSPFFYVASLLPDGAQAWRLRALSTAFADDIGAVSSIVFAVTPGYTARGVMLAECGATAAVCMYTTTDAGTTWTAYTPPYFTGTTESTRVVAGDTTVYAVFVSAQPSKPGQPYVFHDVFAGGVSSVPLPLASAVARPAVVFLTGTPIVLAYNGALPPDATDLGAQLSADSGATWATLPLPPKLSSTQLASLSFAGVPNAAGLGDQFVFALVGDTPGLVYYAPSATLAKGEWHVLAGVPPLRSLSLFPVARGFPHPPPPPHSHALSTGAAVAIAIVVVAAVAGVAAGVWWHLRGRRSSTSGSINGPYAPF